MEATVSYAGGQLVAPPQEDRPIPPPAQTASSPADRPPTVDPLVIAMRHEMHRAGIRRRRRKRALYSLFAVGTVLALGTVGFYVVTGSGWVSSFYFESMLATGQGPPFPLTTAGAQLFAAAMAFLSVGTVITTLLLNLGPILGRIWREGFELMERELRRAERAIADEAPLLRRPPG